jgi:predicted metal-binding membrane protein
MQLGAMCETPMPGGWTVSMAWMRLPGQGWMAAGLSFTAMWTLMMVAMMLPSFVPVLWRRRATWHGAHLGASLLRAVALAVAYFATWAAVGIGVYPVGAGLATAAMRFPAVARAVPLGVAIVVVLAGALQFTRWKARRLACCREPRACRAAWPDTPASAWRHGWRMGRDCVSCCAGLTAILLVTGVMDVGVMMLVTAGITLERLAPSGARAAHAVGVVAIACGALLAARAVGIA